MTDEESPDTDSRRRRLATRRRRIRIVVAVVVIALVALGAGAVALSNHDDTATASTPRHKAPSNSTPAADSSIATTHNTGPPRAISHADPLRLWIGGDSLAGSFGPALGQVGGATGVVDATIDYKVSSGLEDQGIRDWYEHAQQEMASIDPDAVVFIIGTNDASIVNTHDGNGDGVPDWQPDYRAKLDRMMSTLVGGSRHRTVYWLGPPTLGDRTLNSQGYRLGRVMQSEAKKFAPDLTYVDTYHLFSDSSGRYSRDLPDGHGNVEDMRISDGIHFSVDGAKYLAGKLWTALNKRWHITAQADPSQPIDYTIAQGSNDYVPGVGRYRPTVPSNSYETSTSSGTPTSGGTSTTGGSGGSTTTKPVSTTTKPQSTTTRPQSTTTKPTGTTIAPKATPTTH